MIASLHEPVDEGDDFGDVRLEVRPDIRWQDRESQTTVLEVLLVAPVFVTGNDSLEASLFGRCDQPAVDVFRPALITSKADFVADQKASERCGNAVIKQ